MSPPDQKQPVIEFDRQEEVFYITLEDGRLVLNQKSISDLVRLHNKINRGNPLHLFDQKRLNEFHGYTQRLSGTVRDLYAHIDHKEENSFKSRAKRYAHVVRDHLYYALRNLG
ncbi:MAG: hypothetical protein ABIH34_06040 [Nanoarchaeota archaeon]